MCSRVRESPCITSSCRTKITIWRRRRASSCVDHSEDAGAGAASQWVLRTADWDDSARMPGLGHSAHRGSPSEHPSRVGGATTTAGVRTRVSGRAFPTVPTRRCYRGIGSLTIIAWPQNLFSVGFITSTASSELQREALRWRVADYLRSTTKCGADSPRAEPPFAAEVRLTTSAAGCLDIPKQG